MSEFQLGVITSASAVTVALLSPVWGRRSDRWGRRPVFLAALAGTTVGLLGFALVTRLGFHGILALPVLFGVTTVVVFAVLPAEPPRGDPRESGPAQPRTAPGSTRNRPRASPDSHSCSAESRCWWSRPW